MTEAQQRGRLNVNSSLTSTSGRGGFLSAICVSAPFPSIAERTDVEFYPQKLGNGCLRQNSDCGHESQSIISEREEHFPPASLSLGLEQSIQI